MEVFKFGGASVKDAAGIKNVAQILKKYSEVNKAVVISAMGKTTNALEDVVNNYVANNEIHLQYLREIREYHISVAHDLFENPKKVEFLLFALFDTVEQFCQNNTSNNYNFIYDQIVSIGELASTRLISSYLNEVGITNTWVDAREIIRTNNAYTDAKVDWPTTERLVKEAIEGDTNLCITQGFIGGTTERLTTTLGREGSDFTAAILSYCLNATKMTIWKDVPGVLNADPRIFSHTQLIENISYREAIEMTYYGAKVIHPKTIRPLQNKQIPLQVSSFIDFNSVGTLIHSYDEALPYPPIIVKKSNQILLSFSVKDFSFVAEDHLAAIFKAFDKNSLRVNMMHTGAINFTVSVDNDKPIKIESVKKLLSEEFVITENNKLELLTIRHYNQAIIEQELQNRTIVLEQKTSNNVQFLYEK